MAIGQVQYAAYGSLGRHSQMPLEGSRGYFEYLARVGFTKHLGSMAATRGLVDLGDIGAGDLALAVGCGLGKMNGYMVRVKDARVIGEDLLNSLAGQVILTRPAWMVLR